MKNKKQIDCSRKKHLECCIFPPILEEYEDFENATSYPELRPITNEQEEKDLMLLFEWLFKNANFRVCIFTCEAKPNHTYLMTNELYEYNVQYFNNFLGLHEAKILSTKRLINFAELCNKNLYRI